MNLETLVSWSRKAIGFVQAPVPFRASLGKTTNWRKRWAGFGVCQEPLAARSQMLEMVATVLTYAREHGYHLHAKQELQIKLSPLTATKVQDVINWVREHLGTSLEAQRHHAFKPQPPGTKLASTASGAVS